MGDPVAVCGVVATRPRHVRPEVGAPITTFRLVTGGGGGAGGGVGGTDVGGPDVGGTDACNWYTVTATRELALSAAACVARGDPVVVSGTLCVRDWLGQHGGVTAEIEASAIGHDLSWGRSVFTRSVVELTLGAHVDVRGDPTGADP